MPASFCALPMSTARWWVARASRLRIFSGLHARADGWVRSALVVALLQHIAHHVTDDRRDFLPQTIHLALQIVEPALQVVEALVVAVEAGFDRRQIVTITAGLFE